MRIKNHRMPDAKRRATGACVRTASSRVGQSPDPPHYRSRKAHLQHPQEDRCNWSCDNNQDSPRSGIFDELTRKRQQKPRAPVGNKSGIRSFRIHQLPLVVQNTRNFSKLCLSYKIRLAHHSLQALVHAHKGTFSRQLSELPTSHPPSLV